ncbi:MAG TPA: Flp family type IVb pilin [Phycisphaerae bacterium]|nr:Flp family type IVb pilin [Phycisphaerae bacterium]
MRGIRQVAEGATRFLRDETGPSAVEYGVLLALIVMACVGTVQYIGQRAWWVSNVIIDAVDDAG